LLSGTTFDVLHSEETKAELANLDLSAGSAFSLCLLFYDTDRRSDHLAAGSKLAMGTMQDTLCGICKFTPSARFLNWN
jgi:hypothetical protein